MKALGILKQNKPTLFGEGGGFVSICVKKEEISEAIEELEDLEKRRCTNCKYALLDNARYLTNHRCLSFVNSIDYDFCCNKWIKK